MANTTTQPIPSSINNPSSTPLNNPPPPQLPSTPSAQLNSSSSNIKNNSAKASNATNNATNNTTSTPSTASTSTNSNNKLRKILDDPNKTILSSNDLNTIQKSNINTLSNSDRKRILELIEKQKTSTATPPPIISNKNNNNNNNDNNNNNNNNNNNKNNNNNNNNNNNKNTGKNNSNKNTEKTETPISNNEARKQANNSRANDRSVFASEPKDAPEDSIWYTVIKIIILVIVLLCVYYLGNYLIKKYLISSVSTPYLLNTTKNAKHALVISQDPTSINYIPIKKSEGQDGIQFTYGFWFLLDNVDYKKGEWKHIFHKGNSSSYPNRAPGVWFHPDKNSIRVYMNTVENILEYADIDNLPLRKWVYINIILNNKNLDLYVNGYLKIRKELSAIPKQNDDDFWVNMYGGFEGYLSNIRYYSYAIDFNEIYSTIKSGPSTNNCIDTGELPPYLDDNWWFEYNG